MIYHTNTTPHIDRFTCRLRLSETFPSLTYRFHVNMDSYNETSETIRDKVVGLLNRANAAVDKQYALTCLKEIEELLFERTDIDEDDRSALLHEFSEDVVGFHLEPNVKMRSFVVSFIETLAKSYPEQILKVLYVFVNLASDKHDDVVKKTLQAGVHVYRRSLSLLCAQAGAAGKTSDDLRNAVKSLFNLKGNLAMHISSKKDVLRSLTIKFMESVILCHSTVTSDANIVKTSARNARLEPLGADSVSLNDVPKNGSLFDIPSFRKIGEQHTRDLLQVIFQMLESPSVYSMNNIRVVFNTLASLGSHRSALMKIIVPDLLKSYSIFLTCQEKLKTKDFNSYKTCFKSTFLKLLKLTASISWHAELISSLIGLGAKQQAEKAREMSTVAAVQSKNRRRSRYNTMETETGAKKRRINKIDHKVLWPPKSNCIDVLPENTSLLSVNEIVATVIYSMINLPPSPPSLKTNQKRAILENHSAPLKKLMHFLNPLQKKSSSLSTKNAFSFVNHYSFNSIQTEDTNSKIKIELPDINIVMGESGLELKNTAIKVQNLFPFLECFKSPVSHGQSLWQSTIFGCLCSRHKDILDLPGIFSSFLKKLLRSSGKHIFSLFSTEFWFLFMKDTLLPRETGNFKLKYSSIFEKTLCTNLFERGSQFQHHRFCSVAVSTLPIFGEMSLQYFHDNLDRILLVKSYAVVERYLDVLRVISINLAPFRKKYIEVLLKLTVKTNGNLSKKCVNDIVHDLYEKRYFRQSIKICILKLLVAVSKKTNIYVNAKPAGNLMELQICKMFVLICMKDVRMFQKLLKAYAGGTVLGRQIIARSVSLVGWRLAALPDEKKENVIKNLETFPLQSTFLVVELIRSLRFSPRSSVCIDFVVDMVRSTKTSTYWVLVPLLPYLSRDKFVHILSHMLLGSLLLLKAALCVLLNAIHLKSAVLSAEELLVSLHLLQCPNKEYVSKLIKCIQFCITKYPHIYRTDVLRTTVTTLALVSPVPLLLIRLLIVFLQKSPGDQDYILSILDQVIKRLEAKDVLHFDGITRCIFMIKSKQSFTTLLLLPQAYIASRVVCISLYKKILKTFFVNGGKFLDSEKFNWLKIQCQK